MSDSKEHFDLEPTDHPEGVVPPPPPPPPPPPSPPPPSSPKPSLPADTKPLLELAVDTCPKCGTVLAHDAVFCIKCGYDMRTNEVRTPTLGVEKIIEKPVEPVASSVFSAPGRGGLNLLLGIGAAVSIGAMVVAGLNAPAKFVPVVGSVLLCLYEIALHTGTGLVAVLIASRVAELKPGNLELATARVFVAFSTFQLLHTITFGEYRLLVTLLMYPIAMAAYFGLIMLLFRKPRMVATVVLVSHFVLWIGVKGGMELAAYVNRETRAAAAAAPRAPQPAPVNLRE